MFHKMFKSGIFLTGFNKKQSRIIQERPGIVQDDILSPILSNIFLTPLDNFISQLIKKHRKGRRTFINSKCLKESETTEKNLGNVCRKNFKDQLAKEVTDQKKRQVLKKKFHYNLADDRCIKIKYV